MDMIRDENPLNTEVKIPPYTKDAFLSEVYMTEEKYDRLSGVLLNKMNIILQGAPGVGKTFAAKRLAYSLMGKRMITASSLCSSIRIIPMRIS